MAEQLANLWVLLQQSPCVLYPKSQLGMEFSQALKKVNIVDKATMKNEVNIAVNSYLIILDRGMDLKTPLMYDLAFQVTFL